MPVITGAVQQSQAIQFNTGYLDINGIRLATLQDITITAGFSLREIRQLGSIIMAVAPKRYDFKPSAKFKAKSVNQQLLGILWGYSTPDDGGFEYDVVDGQVVLSSVYLTAFNNDLAAQAMQFQFTQAVFGTGNINYKLGDAAEFDLEIMSQNLKAITNYSAF